MSVTPLGHSFGSLRASSLPTCTMGLNILPPRAIERIPGENLHKFSAQCLTQGKHSNPPTTGEGQKRSKDFLRGSESIPGFGEGLAEIIQSLPQASVSSVRRVNPRESAWRRQPWKWQDGGGFGWGGRKDDFSVTIGLVPRAKSGLRQSVQTPALFPEWPGLVSAPFWASVSTVTKWGS